MNSARKITSTIILESFATLKNLQKITNRYLTFNPYLHQRKTDPLYSLLAYNTVVRKDIQNFGHLLVKEKLGPPLLNCQPVQSLFVSMSSYISSANRVEETYFHQKLSKSAENFNSSLRQLNENDMEEKQLRENLIQARNNIEKCLKEIKEQSKQDFKQNQTLSRVFSYIL